MDEIEQKQLLKTELNKLDTLTYILDELENLNTSEDIRVIHSSIKILQNLAEYHRWGHSYTAELTYLKLGVRDFKQNIERARTSISESKKLVLQKLKQLNKE